MGVLLAVFVIGPLLELYVLVQVAQAIGVLPALATLALVSVVGAALVKRQGIAALGRVRAALASGTVPDDELADGFLLLVAGALLIVPGFVTDAVGLALLLPPVRRMARRLAARRWGRRRRVRVIRVDGTMQARTVIDVDGAVPRPRPELER
jgi:UPF0716 protein FxsA